MEKPVHQQSSVSMRTSADSIVQVQISGQHGSLTLQLSGKEPTMAIMDLARPGNYKVAWGLLANGHLKGWLVDEDGRIKWFPARAKPKRKRTTKAPPVRGKAKRQST